MVSQNSFIYYQSGYFIDFFLHATCSLYRLFAVSSQVNDNFFEEISNMTPIFHNCSRNETWLLLNFLNGMVFFNSLIDDLTFFLKKKSIASKNY